MDKLDIALLEVRRMFDIIENNANALDRKAGTIMSSISIILALFGLYIKDSITKPEFSSYQYLLVFLVTLFVLLVLIILFAFWPRNYRLVITPKQEIIKKALLENDDEFAKKKLIAYYLDRIEKNSVINNCKSNAICAANIIYAILLILIIIMSLLIYPIPLNANDKLNQISLFFY